jgi:hypothetical protein
MLNKVFYAILARIPSSSKTPIVSPVFICFLFLVIVRLFGLKLIYQSKKRMEKHKIIYLNDLFNYFLPDLGAYLGIYLLDYLLWIHLKIYYFVLVS